MAKGRTSTYVDHPMTLYLHNSLTRTREEFIPVDPDRITVYVCGPTVYSHPHIGNARPAVVFDVLVRLLRHSWPTVVYARNITDIDDKINASAREEGTDISVISERYTQVYHRNMEALGVLAPDIEPRATHHLDEMIVMIRTLLRQGYAYEADGHVLFHVPAFADYGRLSKRNRDDMIAGARVEIAPFKRDPADFILWKPSTPDLPGWDSPWGRGRPGWHLECSCMIEKHLGPTIDIHGGGIDLVFPHHENEIAQSIAAHDGTPFVRYWLHNGFVNIDREKMAKSQGNVLLVDDLLAQAPGEAIRLALLNAHYRQPLDWTSEGLRHARRMLDRLYGSLRDLSDATANAAAEPEPAFLSALNDDLNTPKALALLFDIARKSRTVTDPEERAHIKGALLASGAILGLLGQEPVSWFKGHQVPGGDHDDASVEEAIHARATARTNRNFAEADRIREELEARGILLEDRPDGTRWRRA